MRCAGQKMSARSLLLLTVAILLCHSVRADQGEQHFRLSKSVHRARCVDEAGCKDQDTDVSSGAASSADCSGGALLYYGGRVMTSTVIQVVFWGKNWATNPGDIISGVNRFMSGYAAQNNQYAATTDEYTGYNGRVGGVSYRGHKIDRSPFPWPAGPWPSDPTIQSSYKAKLDKAVAAKVCAQPLCAKNGNAMVVVIVDQKWTGYNACGWHGSMTCAGSGVHVQFVFLWAPPGGNPVINGTSCSVHQATHFGHSDALALATTVIAHELAEARTDPDLNAWFDACGSEGGDKCAWIFPAPVTFPDGTRWWLQPQWSNSAFAAGTGYANSNGQKGCILAETVPTLPNGFVACASAGQKCRFTGTRRVLFGAPGVGFVVVRSVTSPFLCTVANAGGDPAYGKPKKCYVHAA